MLNLITPYPRARQINPRRGETETKSLIVDMAAIVNAPSQVGETTTSSKELNPGTGGNAARREKGAGSRSGALKFRRYTSPMLRHGGGRASSIRKRSAYPVHMDIQHSFNSSHRCGISPYQGLPLSLQLNQRSSRPSQVTVDLEFFVAGETNS